MIIMNEKELINIIENDESETVEFKKSTAQIEKALKAVCAFLNHKGGTIFFGIEKKKIIGQETGESTLKSISQKIRQRIKPEISPEIRVFEINARKIIGVKIKEGNNKLYYLDGIAYKRVGSENVIIPPDEIERMILEKSKGFWDEQTCEESALLDFDEQKIKQYMHERGIEKPKNMTLNDFLIGVKALHSNENIKPTNGGILFFGNNPQKFFLQARIHCVKFDGNEITKNTIDELMCDGSLKEIVERTEIFVNKNIRIYGFRTEISFKRIEKAEYPLRAIREAVVNALIHRDYREPSEVKIFIFDNRLEIMNPGSFPEGVTPENPVHKPRNPLLCEYMKDIHYIEKYGSGIYLMQKLCKEWSISKPEYVLDKYWTKIIFRPSKAGVLLSEIKNEGINVNDRQTAAINYVLEHNSITNEDYQRINKIGRTTAKLELKELIKTGLFEAKGIGKGTHYVLGATIK